LEKSGGSLAGPGAVAFQFERVGLITLEKGEDAEKVALTAIDLGAYDVEEVEDGIEVYTKPSSLEEFKKKLEQKGFRIKNFELSARPKTTASINDKENAIKILNLMENLEGHPDVNRVFANFDIPNQVLEEIGQGPLK